MLPQALSSPDYDPSPEAGDDRLRAWATGPVQALVLLGIVITLVITGLWIWFIQRVAQAAGDAAFMVDFVVFWSAAKLAIAGTPLAAFDPAEMAKIHGLGFEAWLPWSYPPGFLLAVMPFGLLPFFIALTLSALLSVLALMAAARGLAPGLPMIWVGVALAPTMLAALTLGQTPLLWAAGLMAALWAMRAERPWLAGLFIGLLTLKPQLGLLIPVALLASGSWRTILSASFTTLALAGIGTLVFGAAYWPAMLQMMQTHFGTVRELVGTSSQMISPYSGLVALGLPEAIALWTQPALTLIAALMVGFAWYNPQIGFDLRAAALVAAILISSPYLWHYEAALLAPLALFLIRAGVLRYTLPGGVIALILWLGVGPAMVAGLYSNITDGSDPSTRLLVSPIIAFAFLLTLASVWSRARG